LEDFDPTLLAYCRRFQKLHRISPNHPVSLSEWSYFEVHLSLTLKNVGKQKREREAKHAVPGRSMDTNREWRMDAEIEEMATDAVEIRTRGSARTRTTPRLGSTLEGARTTLAKRTRD
jgi:hypothetical protein